MRKLELKLQAVVAWVFLMRFQSIWVHGFISNSPLSPASPPIAVLEDNPFAPSPGAVVGGGDEDDGHLEMKVLIGLTVVAAVLAYLLVSMICLYISRSSRRLAKGRNRQSDPEQGLSLHKVSSKRSCSNSVGKGKRRVAFVEYETLQSGTNGFSHDSILGGGSLGTVYQAWLEDGSLVAVKRFNAGDADAERQCQNEIDLLSRVQHPNIIGVRGYCAHEDARLLVYELMPNGSLNTQLHGHFKGSALSWHIRMKIALDTARGLEYLHEHCSPQVIHRDLKSSNILLDYKFNAKLTGFGLAVTANQAQNTESIESSGTPGYVAPEYLQDGKLTDKSDVYAFGVILLELLFGRKAVEELSTGHSQSIVTWAIPQLTDRSKIPSIVDPVIKDTMELKHLYQVAAVAVLCVQPEPSYRPLITDVLYSLAPLVPAELGGSGRGSYVTTTCHGNAT
uniref:Protein kinase domain-containing protein n=2 Tax=Kalanchoe fedtschenkoi TaxID=63787 RepID=A0A7N0TC62_KALFE